MQLVNCILLEIKVIIVSPSATLNYMRRNALLIETISELLAPLINVRTVYINISYLKDEMIDYLDSPVPYIIGMSDLVWEKKGRAKFEQ